MSKRSAETREEPLFGYSHEPGNTCFQFSSRGYNFLSFRRFIAPNGFTFVADTRMLYNRRTKTFSFPPPVRVNRIRLEKERFEGRLELMEDFPLLVEALKEVAAHIREQDAKRSKLDAFKGLQKI